VNEIGSTITGVNEVGTVKAPENDERAEAITELSETIKTKRRRLRGLKQQEALYGASAEPSIRIQIEDLEKELAKLQRDLAELSK
jgi:hypothetical protein